MKIRKLTFGYCIRNGVVCMDDRDAQTVRTIFERYIQGESYDRLANFLRDQQVPYIPGKQWNKNIVARILKDSHYIGDTIYPPLLTQEVFQQATAANPWSCDSPEQIRMVKNIRALVRCPSCGKPVTRNFQANWRCPDCMETSVKVTDEVLIMCVTELLAQLIEKAPNIEIPEVIPDTASTQSLENKLSQLLDGAEFDEDTAKANTTALAAAQFEALSSEDYESMRVKYILSNKEQDGEFDAGLLFDIDLPHRRSWLETEKPTNHRRESEQMTETAPRVIVIPAKPELTQAKAVRRQLRVAAYCRVSTDSEEQLTSYEAQKNYYTDKIMTNPEWTMAGIYADGCVIIALSENPYQEFLV